VRRAPVLLLFALLVAAPAAGILSRSREPSAPGAGVDRKPGLPSASSEEDRRSRDLDGQLKDVRGRENEKGRITLGLVRGELDLDRAAARFAALGNSGSDQFQGIRWRYPGATNKELAYRLVLWSIRLVTEVSTDQVAAAQDQIFAAFRSRFPDSPDPAAEPYLRPTHRGHTVGN
jgi:hypothetical protein